MNKLLAGMFTKRPASRQTRRTQTHTGVAAVRACLEELEGRMLLNAHPAGEVPHHIHPHLAIFIDGQNFVIPASVGHTFPGPLVGTFNENAHTHTNDGILHYNEETPAFRNLKEFFDTWGAEFDQSHIKLPNPGGGFTERTVDATHTIRFFVNGAPSTDFQLYEPEDGDQMVVSFEQSPVADTPRINPINNVTMVSNSAAGAPARSSFIPLDGLDPNGSALTYTVSSSNASIGAQLEPASNRFLRLNVSGKDISGNAFSDDVTFQLFDDLAPRTVARIVELVQSGFYTNHFVATISGSQEEHATGSAATGSATLSFNPATGTFDIDVRVLGINLSQLRLAHIHQGVPGVSGPVIFDLGDPSLWVADGNGIRRTIHDATFPAASVADLLAGNTYVNVHTQAFPAGEVRGQLTHIPFHRVLNDFVAQGGDPNGDGTGGSGTNFDDEFDAQATFTGFGQLAMANSGDDTNDSQFFVTDSNLSLVENNSSPNEDPPAFLNFQHTIFGQLVSGFDTFNKIMLTPVHVNPATGERSAPDTPVQINSATIVSDTQHAVLRLSAPANFTGNSTITVTATNPGGRTAQRSFTANVVADTVNDRAFLSSLSDLTTRRNTAVTLPVSATDLENDSLTFVVRDPSNFASQPSNVTVSINQTTRQATLTPAAGFTGTIDLLVGVRDDTRRVDTNGDGQINNQDSIDDRGNFDTQRLRLAVSEANLAPTANSQTVQYQVDTVVTIQLTGDDGDPGVTQTLSFTVDTLPTRGTLRDSNNNPVTVGTALPSATVTYTPNAGFTGSDQFTFKVKDDGGTANGGQDTSQVTAVSLRGPTVGPAARPPRLLGHTLFIRGTRQDDTIDVDLNTAGNRIEVVVNGGTPTEFPLRRVERIRIRGRAGDDAVTVSGAIEMSARIRGGRGDDTLTGGSGPDFIRGGLGNDEIDGGAGNDTLRGGSGDDSIDGGAGDDRVRGGSGNDSLMGGEGRDRIRGQSGDDTIDAGAGNDRVRAGRGNDSVLAGPGDDRLDGGHGNDTMDGGAGLDLLLGDDGNDSLRGGDGNDSIFGNRDDDSLDSGTGTDRLFGGPGHDQNVNPEAVDAVLGVP